MFWMKNSQLSADIVVGRFNLANSRFPHIAEYGTQIILLKWLPHVQLFTCFQKRVLNSSPISRWSLSSVYNFFLFLPVLCLQHERTFSSAYISQVFSACPKHYTRRQIFSFSSNLQTAHTYSFSDDVLAAFVVLGAKLKLPISREEVHRKKIDKLMLSLYLIHLQYVQLIWVLFSRSRKDMAVSKDLVYIIILYPTGPIRIIVSLKAPGTSTLPCWFHSVPKRLLPVMFSQSCKSVLS